MLKSIKLTIIAVSCLPFVGCAQLDSGITSVGSTLAGIVASVNKTAGSVVSTVNNDLANLSKGQIGPACAVVAVAEGYYANVANLVDATEQAAASAAEAAVAAICNNPPTNLTQAFVDLNNLWQVIEASTTVPGTGTVATPAAKGK